MTTEIDVDAIEASANAATPGPWQVTDHNEGLDPPRPLWGVTNDEYHNPSADDDAPWIAVEIRIGDRADAEFIARARTDVPKMAAEIRRLREQLFAQQPVIDAVEAWAEDCEDGGKVAALRNIDRALHDAVEQYRLMDHALTSARNEQPEAAR
jgi:hypothetical protein